MLRFQLLLVLGFGFSAFAEPTMNFNYKDADVAKVIEDYAKASGQKFIFDPKIVGKVTIFDPAPVTLIEAFNELSTALAINSLGLVKHDDVWLVAHARSIQRDMVGVGTELPPVRPEKMFTLVYKLKYASADEVNKQLRILSSKDGELVPYSPRNQIFITDWTPNLHRIVDILASLDILSEKAKR